MVPFYEVILINIKILMVTFWKLVLINIKKEHSVSAWYYFYMNMNF